MEARHPGAPHGGETIMAIFGFLMVSSVTLYMVQQIADLTA
jgi:hypothetical protein